MRHLIKGYPQLPWIPYNKTVFVEKKLITAIISSCLVSIHTIRKALVCRQFCIVPISQLFYLQSSPFPILFAQQQRHNSNTQHFPTPPQNI